MNWLQEIKLETVERRPGQMGWVYFIACRSTRHCKIGFTKGEVEKRLRNLQTGSAGQLMIVSMQPGTVELERRLHERFASQCVHGEWFEMSGELFAYICATVWVMAKLCLRDGYRIEEWVLAGLRMMHEDIGELPEDLSALIGASEPA